MGRRERKPVHKVEMTDGKKNIIPPKTTNSNVNHHQ